MPGRKTKTRDHDRRYRRTLGIARLMPDIVSPLLRRRGFLHREIVLRWHEIVGRDAAARSRPLGIRFPRGKRDNGVLTLAVSASCAPLIQHDSPRILEKINGYFGYAAVARLELRHCAFPEHEARPSAVKDDEPPSASAQAHAERLTKQIEDDKLRALLARWAARIADGRTETGD